MSRETQVKFTDTMISSVESITSLLDALRGIRDVHFEEPLGANATLIRIEQGLKRQLGESVEGEEVG